MVLGGSGGGGTTGAIMFMSESPSTFQSSSPKIHSLNNFAAYTELLQRNEVPFNVESGEIFFKDTFDSKPKYGILVEDLWIVND